MSPMMGVLGGGGVVGGGGGRRFCVALWEHAGRTRHERLKQEKITNAETRRHYKISDTR